MLTRIEIDGFKTFKGFALDVPPFLVVLGQNASGKSNLFDAIAFLACLAEGPGPGARDCLVQQLDRRDGAFNLVVYHRDGASHSERERERWLRPFREVCRRSGRAEPVVPVIPVRTTEAWALVDGDALRSVLGVDWSDARLGLPRRRRDVGSGSVIWRRRCRRFRHGEADRPAGTGAGMENDVAEALQMLPGFRKR